MSGVDLRHITLFQKLVSERIWYTQIVGRENSTDAGVTIRSVNRAMMMLEHLASGNDMGVTEISTALGINKASTYRMLTTFRSLGYVVQDESSERYRLTLRLFEIGSKVLHRMDAIRDSRPALEWLAEETGETVHLAIREGVSILYVDKIDSQHTLRMFSRVGKRAPTWCTGLGKALLSAMPDAEITELFRGHELTAFTPNTITDLTALKAELRRIKQRGFSIDNQEHELGIHCVASVVCDARSKAVAALSVAWPETRHTSSRIDHYSELIVKAANDASRRIGWIP